MPRHDSGGITEEGKPPAEPTASVAVVPESVPLRAAAGASEARDHGNTQGGRSLEDDQAARLSRSVHGPAAEPEPEPEKAQPEPAMVKPSKASSHGSLGAPASGGTARAHAFDASTSNGMPVASQAAEAARLIRAAGEHGGITGITHEGIKYAMKHVIHNPDQVTRSTRPAT